MGARKKILDAAERVFSEHGYSGASMRMIAAAADVSQALLHYHFRSKPQLYNDVFERRATESVSFRLGSIETLFAGGKVPELDALIGVLFASPPEWQHAEEPSFYFTPMVSALAIGEDERSKEMMTRLYDPFAKRFIEALKQVVPALDHRSAVLAYMFALGVRVQVYARNGRIDRLSGSDDKVDPVEVSDKAIAFAGAGIRQIAARDSRPPLATADGGGRAG